MVNLLRKILYIVLILLPCIASAYEDDYVWVEKYKQQLPKAEAGNPDAQYDIGAMYEKGNGVRRDNAAAFEWYFKAASQGDDKAQFKVGYAYFKGRGVSVDTMKAFEWFSKSAKANNVRSQYYLGVMLEKGEGVDHDFDLAMSWYEKARQGGYGPAAERVSHLKELISDEQKRKSRATIAAKRRTEQKKVALVRQSAAKSKKTSVKEMLLAGGWEKRSRPAEYLPSDLTECKDKGATIECVSDKSMRNIGMADISYTTKAVLFGIEDNGEFRITYRNNVVDIKITDPEFIESGGKVPVKIGWQDAEHSLTCTVDKSTELSCKKNKLRKVTFTRAE